MSGSNSTTDFGEHSARIELARCLDVCLDCRQCVEMCGVFPATIELVEERPGSDAGLLTPLDQDQIISLCSHCDLCRDGCPHRPGIGTAAVDLPAAVEALRFSLQRSGRVGWRAGFVARALASDRTLRSARWLRRPVNWLLRGRDGGVGRRALSLIFGLTRARPLPVLADESFAHWFSRRRASADATQHSGVIVPTCLVDQFAPKVGRESVRALEGGGAACALAGVTCCGGGLLESGQIDRFLRLAERNSQVLSESNGPIVVLQPSCLEVLRSDYPRLLGSSADGLAARVRGVVEHLDVTVPDAGARASSSLPVAIGLIGSPRGRATGEDERLVARLERRGVRVVHIETGSLGEGPGALTEARDAAESFVAPSDVPDDLPLFGSSVIINRMFQERLGRLVEPAQALLAVLATDEANG